MSDLKLNINTRECWLCYLCHKRVHGVLVDKRLMYA